MSLWIKLTSILVTLFLFVITGFGLAYLFGPIHPKKMPLNQTYITIGSNKLIIELVTGPESISKGLGDRDELGSDGMLFVMPSRSVPTFWMKGMRFDLDFVWIDGERVVDITENVLAEPGVRPEMLKTYSPRSPITHVLEMNAGEIKKRNIRIGDIVSY